MLALSILCATPGYAQSASWAHAPAEPGQPFSATFTAPLLTATTAQPAYASGSSSSSDAGTALMSASEALPAAPEPSGMGYGANPQREVVPYAAIWHQPRFSRIGVGVDLSPLGIGIKATTPLDDYFDVRATMGFLNININRVEIEGVNLTAQVHMASFGAAVDLYPWNSVWRVSAGAMLFNGNRISAATRIVSGTSFKLDGTTYYSSAADPVTGTGEVDLHNLKIEPMVSFGFGRYVPHSNRHWSFPTEFGVIYTGAPTLTVSTAGAVCTDKAQTMCSSISDTGSPVGQAFNSSLNAQLAKWRADLSKVEIYPIFSYGVVYSFNIR